MRNACFSGVSLAALTLLALAACSEAAAPAAKPDELAKPPPASAAAPAPEAAAPAPAPEPETPPVTPASAPDARADNPILAAWTGPYGGVPPFDKVADEHFLPAMEAVIAAQLAEMDAIAGNSEPPDI